MRYEVPQFIEIEDKIVGPLTWKQFVFLAGGAGGAVLLWLSLPPLLAIILIVPIAVFALALAFYRYNQRPFILLLESWFFYTFGSKLYIWKKREKKVAPPSIEEEVQAMVNPQPYVPKMSDSKLKDMAWALDIDRGNQGEVL